jgi:hypothetical protein
MLVGWLAGLCNEMIKLLTSLIVGSILWSCLSLAAEIS